MQQAPTEQLRSLLKDLLAARDEQKCIQRTLTEIDYFDRVEKRYEKSLLDRFNLIQKCGMEIT